MSTTPRNPLAEGGLDETAARCVAVLETLASVAGDGAENPYAELGTRLILRTVIEALEGHAECRRVLEGMSSPEGGGAGQT